MKTHFLIFFVLIGLHFSLISSSPTKLPAHSVTHRASLPPTDLDSLGPLRSCFDVGFYDLSVTFHPESKSISGEVEVHATAMVGFDSLQLDLHSNLKVSSVFDLELQAQLAFKRTPSAIIVYSRRELGDFFQLRVKYEGSPIISKNPPWDTGFIWRQKDNTIGVVCQTEGAYIWWPLKDHLTDEPDSMRTHFSINNGQFIVGNGQFEGQTKEGDYTTYHWFSSYPINPYNVTFYVGEFELINSQYEGIEGDTLPLSYYVLPKHRKKAEKHFRQVQDILKVYEKYFGPYPWYRDGLKLIESNYKGMEHQTAIAYGNQFKNDEFSNTFDYILVHEIAHEWWGNSVSCGGMVDMWLQEGFATYAEALYVEETLGRPSYEKYMALKWERLYNELPLRYQEDGRYFNSMTRQDVYSKGALILYSLRNLLENDPLFFEILRSWHTNNTSQIVDSDDFIAHVNEKSGLYLTWFFNQYLDVASPPILDIRYKTNQTIEFWWSNVQPEFKRMPIKVIIGSIEVTLVPSTEPQILTIPAGVPITFIYEKLYYVYQEN